VTLEELETLLKEYNARRGTDPSPRVKHGLKIAKLKADKRFSHLIIITDLNAQKMNEVLGQRQYQKYVQANRLGSFMCRGLFEIIWRCISIWENAI
jgi:uncharacterized protein with von Willebrand factor type A (vWA) domain